MARLRDILAEEGLTTKEAAAPWAGRSRALGKKIKGAIREGLDNARGLVHAEMNDSAWIERRLENYTDEDEGWFNALMQIRNKLDEIEKVMDRKIAS